ncbi:MAG: tRNA (adenosine(37)-N6)-threonylcarbamoyltransferase complex dimerization subunit type 1 TsaB [Rikenellaceae bacterium]|jgi:tRNA threonylcarbamoyladenosine biosynthesis protein TsaB|nr:tRNA (adenosine(37)-N6)-threonylcarbamoyltransferase complex dimerization subunit type 1 TsaB [Rikenellaceae bacterium]
MALILSLETGTEICSVGLARDGRLLSLRENSEGRNHARLLGVYVQELLEEMQIAPDELDAVAVGQGPGSYTGLRVGVSLGKGLCYGANIPLVAVNSLQSLAAVAVEDFEAGILPVESLEGTLLCPMIDARRMEVYTQRFTSALEPIGEVEALILDENSLAESLSTHQVLIFGDGAPKAKGVIDSPNLVELPVLPSARGMARLAEEAFARGDFADTAYFEPYYLKDFVVIPSRKKIF